MERPKRTYNLTPEGLEAKRAATASTNRRRSKPVVCLTDGGLFCSIGHAAEKAGVCHSAMAHSIKRGGLCRGKKYALAESMGFRRGEGNRV